MSRDDVEASKRELADRMIPLLLLLEAKAKAYLGIDVRPIMQVLECCTSTVLHARTKALKSLNGVPLHYLEMFVSICKEVLNHQALPKTVKSKMRKSKHPPAYLS